MSNYPNIIALVGKRGAGKDTVADMIASATTYAGGVQWGRLSFAAPLKDCAAIITGLDRALLDTQEGKTQWLDAFDRTAGQFLQDVGVGLRDLIDTDIWVSALMAKVKPERHYLITDCRFPNEVAAIEKAGGYIVRIAGDPMGQRGDNTRDDNHPSEVALDHLELPTIRNNSTPASLRAKVTNLLRVLNGGKRPTVAEAKLMLAFK